jgi:hypothetical protein
MYSTSSAGDAEEDDRKDRRTFAVFGLLTPLRRTDRRDGGAGCLLDA